MVSELYQERIGGASVGDVFTIGDDDILSLALSSTGGLEKASNEVAVKVNSTGGLETASGGTAIKIKSAGGLETDADGLQLTDATKHIDLPIATGGGTSTVSAITGATSIDFNADAETAYAKFHVPLDWDAASNLTLKATIQNQIAEDDGDDISFTCTIHGVADGETNADAGQAVALALNLTGGDQAINKANLVSGTIDYNHATYPIAAGDAVIIKIVANLGGAGECTGPLHIIDWWIEYTSNKRGT